MHKLRYLSLNMIPHKQLILHTGNTLREEIMPKERCALCLSSGELILIMQCIN